MKRGSRSVSRRYRKRAPNSQVDDTLFGGETQRKEETVQIITKDLIRNLRIRSNDPSGEPMNLPAIGCEQITSVSRFLTKEEREAQRKAYQRKKEEEHKAEEEMTRQLYEIDLSRKNKLLTKLELEARDRALRSVEQVSTLKMEEEEEIKKLNKLILAVQCQATWDAQIQEKQQIQAKLSEEEKRLDAMMEVERCKALETLKQIDELHKDQRIRVRQQISDQIQEHQEVQQTLEEMKEQERQQIRRNEEKTNLENLKALEKKREEQQRLQEEIIRINAETVRAKEQRRKEEKLADMRDMEFVQNKMEREAKYEAEQRRIKKEKELEIASLRGRQQKAKDYKAEQDELRARRNQEIADREWRKKVKDLAEKKAQEDAMLKAALLEQAQCRERFLSMEAGREKAEFERVLKAQQEMITKQKEEEKKLLQKAQRHAEALRNQVKQCELSATAKRREIFKEADLLMEEARQRRARLDEIKEKKLKELKAAGLPEIYCSKVERKAGACAL